jgi:hypothetical protein
MSKPKAPEDRLASEEMNNGAPEVFASRGPVTSKLIRSVLIFAVAGVVLYGGATLASDYKAVIGSILEFPVGLLGLVIGLVFVGWLLRAWRFH